MNPFDQACITYSDYKRSLDPVGLAAKIQAVIDQIEAKHGGDAHHDYVLIYDDYWHIMDLPDFHENQAYSWHTDYLGWYKGMVVQSEACTDIDLPEDTYEIRGNNETYRITLDT